MPLPLHLLAVLDVFGATAKKTSSSSSFFLIFLVVIAGAYMLFIAPQRRKQRAQMSQQRNFEVGDEVVTTGGMYGRVEASDGDRVALDIAEGVVVEVARTAIARRVDAATAAAEVAGTGSDDGDTEVDDERAEVASHDWEPPVGDEPVATNGTSTGGGAPTGGAGTNGSSTNGVTAKGAASGATGTAHPDATEGDWADPWSTSPSDGEKGAPGAPAGSA